VLDATAGTKDVRHGEPFVDGWKAVPTAEATVPFSHVGLHYGPACRGHPLLRLQRRGAAVFRLQEHAKASSIRPAPRARDVLIRPSR